MLTGDYFVTATHSWVGEIIRKLTFSPVNHAGIYVGDGQIVEAMTQGAVLSKVEKYPDAIWSTIPLTGSQRIAIEKNARTLIGTPYNFLDIAAQTVVRVFRWSCPQWALNRLARPDRLQCAQLVDLAYAAAGVHLFPDGRPVGLISPEDLYAVIGAK